VERPLSVRQRGAAISSDPIAESAAQHHLASGGSALGAVLSGFFAASGSHPGVLLGPISIVVAGIGAGGRAFDGRLRQPGLSGKRPRGLLKGEVIPESARVAAPASVAAAAVAYGYEPHGTLARVVRPGVEQAERVGARSRGRLLERICSVGALAMNEPAFTRPLLRVASPVCGGQVTLADLSRPGEIDHEVAERDSETCRVFEPPWADGSATPELLTALGRGQAICAVDVHGLFAALAFRQVESGVLVEELELLCPLVAEPTRRGEARLKPGTPLFAPAPIAVAVDRVRGPVEVFADARAVHLDASAAAPLSIRRDPSTRLVQVVKAS
jgi:hypothetical protein